MNGTGEDRKTFSSRTIQNFFTQKFENPVVDGLANYTSRPSMSAFQTSSSRWIATTKNSVFVLSSSSSFPSQSSRPCSTLSHSESEINSNITIVIPRIFANKNKNLGKARKLQEEITKEFRLDNNLESFFVYFYLKS